VRTQIIISAIALSSLSCGEDVSPIETGEMELTWQVSPRGCSAADVENVRIEVRGTQTYREVVACAAGSLRLRDVVADNYKVSIEGLDRVGVVRFTADTERVTVRPNLTSRTSLIKLTAKPAAVNVEWRFSDGKVCGAHGAEQVDITVFDKLDYQIQTQRFRCNDGAGGIEGLMAGTYLVEAVAAGSEEFFVGLSTIAVTRGDIGEVEIVLEPFERP